MRFFIFNLFLFFNFCFFTSVFAQAEADLLEIDLSFTPTSVEVSPGGKYLILENPGQYEIWNIENQQKIISNTYKYTAPKFFKMQISGLSEGSGYFLFPREDIFLTADYKFPKTELKAYDLSTGKEIWKNDKLDIDVSDLEQYFKLFAAGSDSNLAFPSLGSSLSVEVDADFFTKDQILAKLINYLPSHSKISVNGKEGLQLLDLKTGETKWIQENLKGGVGEIFYDSNHEIMVVIEVHNSDIKSMFNRPQIHGVNFHDGNILWTTKYDGDFIPQSAFVHKGVLVLPFYGLQLIDIQTGEESEGAVKKGMERSRKHARTAISLGGNTSDQSGNTLPLLGKNNLIHYFTGYQRSTHINPTGGRKAYLQIDILNDKIISAEENLAKMGNSIIQEHLTDERFYVKMTTGLSNTCILGMDSKTGKKVFETPGIRNRLGTDFDFFTLSDDKIIDVSSKGVHTYDALTGKEISFIDFKDIGVGRFRNYMPFKNGLILFGAQGISFTDLEGNILKNIKDTKRINDFLIGENEIWLVEERRFIRLDIKTLENIEIIDFKRNEDILMSPSGNSFFKINQDATQLTMYKT